jgi:excisionase family DNA binding protein
MKTATVTSGNKPAAKRGYSVEAVAEQLGLSKGFVWSQVRSGRLRSTRFSRRVVILHEDLENYITSQRVEGNAA